MHRSRTAWAWAKSAGELEDLGFRYVDPISYQQVHDAVEARRKAGEAFLAKVETVCPRPS